MSMWKPIVNQAHFDRMHTKKEGEKFYRKKFYKANSMKELF